MTLPDPSAPPPPVGGGVFEVDIAQAPKAIRELEDARRELQAIRQDALSLGEIKPPAADQVSLDAARMLADVATAGPQSFIAALEAGIEETTRLIEGLRVAFDKYQNDDERSEAIIARRP